MKKTLIFLIIFSIIINFAYALTEYPQVGGDNDFILGTSLWNDERSDDCSSGEILCSTRNIDNPDFTPFVSDLDNNGINEIIISDGLNIRLYQDSSLTIVDAFILAKIPRYIIIFDIDGDNLSEIIVYQDDSIEIVEYNGTSFFQQTTFPVMTSREEPLYIQCRNTNDCIAFVIESSIPNDLFAIGFNSTDVSTPEKEILSIPANTLCNNTLGHIGVGDVDNDGSIDYVVSIGEITATNAGKVNILWVNNNGTELVLLNSVTQTIKQVGASCSGMSDYTSPLVFDIDGSVSNGLETVVGIMIDTDDFKMYSFTSTGVFLDDYPEITDGEGILISNVFRGNFFTDTGNVDFCVLGYENDVDILNLICASEQTGQIPETNGFTFDKTGIYNVTDGWHLITHSTQQDNTLTSGTDLSEIINSYGVFSLDFVLINELILIWENPKIDAVVYNVDYEQIGLDDILVLTDTNIWYIDDLFINQNANLSRYTTNPSIRSIIKVNESVSVTITCLDREGDNVMAGLIAYQGSSNEQKINSTFGGSGTVFPLSFEANRTISAGFLEIFCRDINHNETVGITTTFSVAINGASFGDSIFDSGNLLAEPIITPIGEGGTNQTATNNIVREGIIDFSNSIRITPTFLLIFLILIGNVFLIASMSVVANLLKASLVIALSLDILGIALFSYLQLISAVWVVSLIFILILVGALWIFSRLTSGGDV